MHDVVVRTNLPSNARPFSQAFDALLFQEVPFDNHKLESFSEKGRSTGPPLSQVPLALARDLLRYNSFLSADRVSNVTQKTKQQAVTSGFSCGSSGKATEGQSKQIQMFRHAQDKGVIVSHPHDNVLKSRLQSSTNTRKATTPPAAKKTCSRRAPANEKKPPNVQCLMFQCYIYLLRIPSQCTV